MCFKCWTLSLPTSLLICSTSAGQVESKQRTQSAKLIRELCRRRSGEKKGWKIMSKVRCTYNFTKPSSFRRFFSWIERRGELSPSCEGGSDNIRQRTARTHHFFNSHTFYSSRQSLRLIVKIIKINCLRFCFHHQWALLTAAVILIQRRNCEMNKKKSFRCGQGDGKKRNSWNYADFIS